MKCRLCQFFDELRHTNDECPSPQLMTDVVGNPEEERRASFYHEPWSQEAVSRYFYCKVNKVHLVLLL